MQGGRPCTGAACRAHQNAEVPQRQTVWDTLVPLEVFCSRMPMEAMLAALCTTTKIA